MVAAAVSNAPPTPRPGGGGGALFERVDSLVQLDELLFDLESVPQELAKADKPPALELARSSGAEESHCDASGMTGEESGGEERPEARKRRNAAACRKHREKRKREAHFLRVRNSELEAQRGQLLSRIADLQMTAQSFRGGTCDDLRKENELLRAEITKHRRVVNSIQKLHAGLQADLPEEQYRVALEHVESGFGKVVGMCYASASDPSWTEAQPCDVHGMRMRTKFQFLPHGASAADAKRINVRFDFDNLPMTSDRLFGELEQSTGASECLRVLLANASGDGADGQARSVEKVRVAELEALASQMRGEVISCTRYAEEARNDDDKEGVETFFLKSHTRMSIFPMAFSSAPCAEEAGLELQEAVVSCSTAASADIEALHLLPPTRPETQRVFTSGVYGHVVRPACGRPGHSHLTTIWTFQLDVPELHGLVPLPPPAIAALSADAGPPPAVLRCWQQALRFLP